MNPPLVAHDLPAAVPSANHHGSHSHLLSRARADPRDLSHVDAIVVPTARHPASLRAAMDLSAKLGCTFVALCSKWASARETAKLARRKRIEAIVIDTARLPRGLMPRFETTELVVGTRFERWTDTSLKRNLGLLLARLIGWQRIVFLDDDIAVKDPNDLKRATRLLESQAGVGLSNIGFPDNSVVCHAYRNAGGQQDTFIGGGSLAVGSESMTSFFPNIYNEDWFFLLDDIRLRPSTLAGIAIQQSYDPFASDQRARLEEFGDTLAEGVFWLLDHGERFQEVDGTYWRASLDRRRRFINEVLERVVSMDNDPGEKNRMISVLKAARGRSQLITPSMCVEYLQAWQADREMWRRHVDALYHAHRRKTLDNPTMALSALGLTWYSEYVPPGGPLVPWSNGDEASILGSELLDKDVTSLGIPNPAAVGTPLLSQARH